MGSGYANQTSGDHQSEWTAGLQGQQAVRGLQLWASADEIELEIVDDAGMPATVSDVYQNWLSAGTDLLLGLGSGA